MIREELYSSGLTKGNYKIYSFIRKEVVMVRVGVFIDVQNIQETFERQGGEVRYDILKDYILKTYNAKINEVKFLAFIPYKEDDDKRLRLIDALSFMGFRVFSKRVKERPNGSFKANMDVEMVLEAVALAPHLDEIVLISGDSDFVPLIDFLSKMGKRITVLGPGRGPTSIELIRASDEYKNLDEVEGVVIRRYPLYERPKPEEEIEI